MNQALTEARENAQPRGERGMTLVELLVVMVIMSIVGTMLVATWISLSNSYAFTTTSCDARDFARFAASRMEREFRDAEAQVTTGYYQGLPAVLWASANKIRLVTTFNNAGNDDPVAKPLAIEYYLQDGSLYRRQDANDNGLWDTPPRVVIPNVVNASMPKGSGGTPMFSYTYITDNGAFVTVNPADDSTNLSLALAQRARIVSVTINLLVDLSPSHAPTYMHITTTAQLRNQRRF